MKSAAAQLVLSSLKKLANPEIAAHSKRFFKTGVGDYGEGDQFLGIRVPIIRQQVKKHKNLDLDEVLELIRSPFHEVRLFAILKMVDGFEKGDKIQKGEIYQHYLNNTQWVNNWDLVDSSAHKIVGAFLIDKPRDDLYRLARSNQLWERRIAMIACYFFIKRDDFKDTLKLAEIFLDETHDLMHKAVGWMLRELGKRDFDLEYAFLVQHYQQMPRTALRYSIEKFPKDKRETFMKGQV